MITESSIKTLKQECELISALSHLAWDFIRVKPEEECFTPFRELMDEAMHKLCVDKPFEPVFKNGICINDESEDLAYAIVYAAKKIDVSKMLSELFAGDCNNLSEEIISEFRYNLAFEMYRFMRFDEIRPLPFIYNSNTIDWGNVYDKVCKGKIYGRTLTL